MKVLIVYDTVSPNRNTERVADAMRDTLQTRGIEVESSIVINVEASTVKDHDCLIVGSPTQGWTATKPIIAFLDSLRPMSYSGKMATAFDTRTRGWYARGATDNIEERLSHLGFRIILPGMAAYVTRERTDAGITWTIKVEELGRAKQFAEKIAQALQ
jgi:flavodoxin